MALHSLVSYTEWNNYAFHAHNNCVCVCFPDFEDRSGARSKTSNNKLKRRGEHQHYQQMVEIEHYDKWINNDKELYFNIINIHLLLFDAFGQRAIFFLSLSLISSVIVVVVVVVVVMLGSFVRRTTPFTIIIIYYLLHDGCEFSH